MKKRVVLTIGSVLRIPEKAIIIGTYNEGCNLIRKGMKRIWKLKKGKYEDKQNQGDSREFDRYE